MEISPTRTGTQVVAGGAVGGALVGFAGRTGKHVAFGAGAGAVASLAQSYVYQRKGATDSAGLLSLGAGMGAGAVTGAALFSLMSVGARSPMKAAGVGFGLGLGVGLVASFGSFIAAHSLLGPVTPADPVAPGLDRTPTGAAV